MKINEKIISIKKELIIKLLKKEGVQGLINQYGGINNLPIFKNKIAYGKKHFPWSLQKKTNKNTSTCLKSEYLNNKVFFAIEVCLYELNNKDIDLIIKSFEKVWKKILKK